MNRTIKDTPDNKNRFQQLITQIDDLFYENIRPITLEDQKKKFIYYHSNYLFFLKYFNKQNHNYVLHTNETVCDSKIVLGVDLRGDIRLTSGEYSDLAYLYPNKILIMIVCSTVPRDEIFVIYSRSAVFLFSIGINKEIPPTSHNLKAMECFLSFLDHLFHQKNFIMCAPEKP
jgi:hypothetical protein